MFVHRYLLKFCAKESELSLKDCVIHAPTAKFIYRMRQFSSQRLFTFALFSIYVLHALPFSN